MASFRHSDLQPFVDRLASHSELSAEERQAICQLPSRTAQIAANRDVVRLGDRIDHACFIIDGLAARYDQNVDGERQTTAFHIPGDMADLHSVVLPHATTGLQALTTTTFAMIQHLDLRALARSHPRISEAFWRECMIDAAILSQWVVNAGRRNAKTRMAHLLCEMAVRYGGNAIPKKFILPITQGQLAEATALTPVHVNRTLKALREEGLAIVRFREVQVLDWNGLQEAGEFDSAYLNAGARPRHDRGTRVARPQPGQESPAQA